MGFFTLLVGGPFLMVVGLLFMVDRKRSSNAGMVLFFIGGILLLLALFS